MGARPCPLYRSEFEEAQSTLKEAIHLGLESNTMPQVHKGTVELAACLLQLGDHQESARLAISMLKDGQDLEKVRRKAEQVLAACKAQQQNLQQVESVACDEISTLDCAALKCGILC